MTYGLSAYLQDQDAPSAVLLSTHHPVANKQHKCMMCGLMINIGEKYLKQVFECEGKIETYKRHSEICC